MAELPIPKLRFVGVCPDCGSRQVVLPPSLPPVGDDFDWRVRDYDSFRVFLLEELIARFPERTRWTAADLEVVIIEVLAAVFDQLSDQLDRVASEAVLETARRPDSVRRLLRLLGFEALGSPFDRPGAGTAPDAALEPTVRLQREAELDLHWLQHPEIMEDARRAGPRQIREQRRMVTVEDYARRLEDHPLVLRAHSWLAWTGSWTTVRGAVVAWNERRLDEPLEVPAFPAELQSEVDRFHRERGLPLPEWSGKPSIRQVLALYLDAWRMAGQEILLSDAVPVGILLHLVVTVDSRFFRSEVQQTIEQVLGRGPGGFFAPGRLRFGEDLHASDIFQLLLGVEGVADICIQRFKRVGSRHPDRTLEGRITLQGLEVAICDNNPLQPARGYFRLTLVGGRRG